MTICTHIETASPHESPLKRMLITGYYDGATNGIVECQVCGRAYAFRTVAWDDEQEMRVFILSTVAPTLNDIRRALNLVDDGKATVVVPPLGEKEDAVLESLLRSPPECAVASLDLRTGIVVQRTLAGDDGGERDWLAWLGLKPSARS